MAVTQLTISISSDLHSTSIVRRFVRMAIEVLDRRGVDGDIAELLTTELVANGIDVDAGDVIIGLRPLPGGVLRVEVLDHGYGLPEVGRRDLEDAFPDFAHGLDLVEELSDRWGVEQFLPGKTVWFELESHHAERTRSEAMNTPVPMATGAAARGRSFVDGHDVAEIGQVQAIP